MGESQKKSLWIIVEDGLTGTENQCIGVAGALGIKPDIKRIHMKFPWSLLSPHVQLKNIDMYLPEGIFNPPYPDIAIGAGRKSVDAMRLIRQASGGKTFTVQLQDPKVPASNFDLVAAPYHDAVRGSNVIVTDGAPNRITSDGLKKAKEAFAPQFEKLEQPRIAVLIGGKSKAHDIGPIQARHMAEKLSKLKGSLMATISRRTAKDSAAILQKALDKPGNYFWDGRGENPYMGLLAWADHILVTEDSVSMMSDAGSTGKPVHIIDIAGGSARFEIFKDHMKSIGVAKDFTGNLEPWSYEPLRDAQKIADAIKERIK